MSFRHTVNLGNSIIGVSLLAMPFCFKHAGILLSILLIILSNLLNRSGCNLLLVSARLSRCRNFQHLAYSVFGSKGKTLVEMAIVGFLLGTAVALFVVIGDLGPSLTSQMLSIPNTPHLRAFIMTFLGMFVALPLGLLRRVDSLASFSALSMVLYGFLVLKLFVEASETILQTDDLWTKLNWWNSSHILTTLPIFVTSLSCQPQLFEIFEPSTLLSEDYATLNRLNRIIKSAVNICSLIYIMVGILGYLAFHHQSFEGNILLALSPNISSALTKAGFVFTVIISIPFCLFPCRSNLHSMLVRGNSPSLLNEHSLPNVYMSDRDFRTLTLLLITCTIGISILIPHIELILGLIGSTIGAFVCFILPGLFYIHLTNKSTNERMMAFLVTYIGFFVLIACTYSTMNLEADPLIEEKFELPKVVDNIAAEIKPALNEQSLLHSKQQLEVGPISKSDFNIPKPEVIDKSSKIGEDTKATKNASEPIVNKMASPKDVKLDSESLLSKQHSLNDSKKSINILKKVPRMPSLSTGKQQPPVVLYKKNQPVLPLPEEKSKSDPQLLTKIEPASEQENPKAKPELNSSKVVPESINLKTKPEQVKKFAPVPKDVVKTEDLPDNSAHVAQFDSQPEQKLDSNQKVKLNSASLNEKPSAARLVLATKLGEKSKTL